MSIASLLKNNSSYERLHELLKHKVLLFDGAMGTCLQGQNLGPSDFGGEVFEGCNENLVLTRPELIQSIHAQYYRAGSDIVETNTFGATPLVLAEYDLAHKAEEINHVAATLARKAALEVGGERFVAGSMGPTTKAISVTGGVTHEELVQTYRVQTRGLITGGCDFLLLETAQDTVNLKCAIQGIHLGFKDLNRSLPLVVSVTIEPSGTMLAGQSIEAVATSLAHLPLIGIGMNCSTGPEFMTSHVRALAELVPFPVLCMPNAGLPDENGKYRESPQDMGRHLQKFNDSGYLNFLGGCCGTTPEYIKHFNQIRQNFRPRPLKGKAGSFVSGIDFLEIEDGVRPLLVGERTNIIGSRQFKQLVIEGKWEDAAELGRKQVKSGAQILDICLANPDRNEHEDIMAFLPEVLKKIKAPLMIDSTDDSIFEAALKILPGKCMLNSINLETGEDRFEKVSELILEYGGSVVVGCIDEDPLQGMAVTKERKLEVAARSFELLTQKYGLQPEDICFDPLVFPCGTGDANYITSAKETVEGIRLIKERFPKCKTILGISNVSFGLPDAGREILNSVFLYHCTRSGLDLAIVNSQKIERYANIDHVDRELCEKLIFENNQANLDLFVAHFRTKKTVKKETDQQGSVEERLIAKLVEGSKDNLIQDLDEARLKYAPLDIINGPLMEGMAKVGKLFNDNELIVAEVLQSASVMKAAVSHLQQFMQKSSDACKARVLLATVKGDVHDIGKNLVEIILGNNGYEILNLGIKVNPETIVAAYREHKPDFIGLSGLLVKSALQMVDTVQDLKSAGIEVPILVGGAALSRRFTDTRIAPGYGSTVLYAVDAMTGLEFVNSMIDPIKKPEFLEEYQKVSASLQEAPKNAPKTQNARTKLVLEHSSLRERPSNFERQLFHVNSVKEVFPYLNEQFFYTQHMGFKGSIRLSVEQGDERAVKLKQQIEDLKADIISGGWLDCRGVYQFFEAESEGNALHLYNGQNQKVETFLFPRQASGEELCVADFAAPKGKALRDTVAMFAISSGSRFREVAEKFKKDGDFFRFHALQALVVETAEALAEMLHQHIRKNGWGIQEDLSFRDLIQTRYQGIRLSFGYPACPNLDDQAKLFGLLKPEEIGIQLTENMMMDPEGSVSAIVFSHPQAKYFNVES